MTRIALAHGRCSSRACTEAENGFNSAARARGLSKREILVGVLVLAFGFLLLGCSGNPGPQKLRAPEALTGVVLIDVLQGGAPEHYWQYEVQLATGDVLTVKQEIFQDYKHEDFPSTFSQPAGYVASCAKNPQAVSADGMYVALCSGEQADEFYVINKRTGERLYHSEPGRRVRGFAWAPNQNLLAVLDVSSRIGKKPPELLALASGHPVSHDTVFLDLFDVKTAGIKEILVRPDVVSAFTRILQWRD